MNFSVDWNDQYDHLRSYLLILPMPPVSRQKKILEYVQKEEVVTVDE